MAYKVQFMWVLDVSSTELHCMVTNLRSNQRIGKQDFCLRSVADLERRKRNQVKRAQTRRNQASILIQQCQFSISTTLKKWLKVHP